MSLGRIIQYKCNRCGAKQERQEVIGIPYEALKCCNVKMVRDWSVSMNITQVSGFCGKVG